MDALNAAADFNGNTAISLGIDVSLMLRAFPNDAADEFVFAYNEAVGHHRDKNVLLV